MAKKEDAPATRKIQARNRRSRKLLHSCTTIKERAKYLCEYLCGGDITGFANKVGVDATYLRLRLSYNSRLSAATLAQFMRTTQVRAEWLLCGIGPMFAAGMPEGLDTLALPVELRSAFPLLDTELSPAIPRPAAIAVSSHEPGEVTPAAIAAAQAIAQARGALKPVYMLLGKDALYAGARPVVTALLTKKYVTGVGLTAAAADLDVPNSPTIDKTLAAKLGAQAGLGFGEALCRWAEPPDNSIVDVAQRMSAAITVHPEFGEVIGHFQTSLRGAELGAAIGAVAYVDGLIFAENVRTLVGEPAGVCIAVGEARRASNLFLQALQASRHPDAPERRTFEFVLIDHALDRHIEHTIRCNGGQFHFIQGDLASGADGLAKACDAVFDGTI